MPASIRDTDSKVVRSFDPLLPPLYGKIRVGTTPSRAPVIAPLVGVFVVFDAHPLLPTCGRPAPVSSWCVSCGVVAGAADCAGRPVGWADCRAPQRLCGKALRFPADSLAAKSVGAAALALGRDPLDPARRGVPTAAVLRCVEGRC